MTYPASTRQVGARGSGQGSLSIVYDPTATDLDIPLAEDPLKPWETDPTYDWTPLDGDLIGSETPPDLTYPDGQPDSLTDGTLPPTAASGNLIQQSSFEAPRGWTIGPGWTVPYATATAFHGSAVARFVGTGRGSELATTAAIPVDTSRHYWASFRGRMPSFTAGLGRMVLREYNDDGLLLRTTVVGKMTDASDGWLRYSRRFVPKAQQGGDVPWHHDTTKVRLAFEAARAPTLTWEVDAAFLAPGAIDGEYTGTVSEVVHGEDIAPSTLPITAFASDISVPTVVDVLPDPALFAHRMVFLTTDHRLYVSDGTSWTPLISAPDLSDLPTGIETVSALPSLPSGTYPAGSFVYLMTDGKLYRVTPDGLTWTPEVAAVDITGQITGGQISDAAITLQKFAAGLRPLQVVSGLPVLPDAAFPDGAMVVLLSDHKVYRSTGTAWTTETAAADISGQLTAGQIGDFVITARKMNVLTHTIY